VFRKEQPLTERGGKAIAELLRAALEGNGYAGKAVHPTLCLAIDVFAGAVYRGSANRTRVLEEIRSACRRSRFAGRSFPSGRPDDEEQFRGTTIKGRRLLRCPKSLSANAGSRTRTPCGTGS
jgi:hypothetical protein